MADSLAEDVSNEASTNEASTGDYSPADGELSELRDLLLKPEQLQLLDLQKRLDDPQLRAEAISEVLPEAVDMRGQKDAQLTKSLLPSVEEAIKISVKRDPRVLVNAIFPVIGPAIRKAIFAAISSMTESFNKVLEQSLSWQGFKWRLEALRTGRSFAEVVMFHTLLYRVEQVFLIHKETGLLLQHVVAQAVVTQDADMISGMLTAIQDFARDSFGVEQGESLEAMQLGDLTLWVEQGPQAIIAGAIRGNAPKDLRLAFQDALEKIHLEKQTALDSFEGDAAPFETIRDHLEACLQAQYDVKKKEEGASPRLLIVTGSAAFLLLFWGFFVVRDNWRWSSYIEKLRAERGIVVAETEKRGGKFFIYGLRDPLAADPNVLLKEANLDPKDVASRWEPYQAFHPDFILARSKTILEPPEGVSLKFDSGILYVSGSASHQWVVAARRTARAIPGIAQFDDKDLIDVDLKAILPIKERIEKQVVRFTGFTSQIAPGQDDAFRELVIDIQKLNEAGRNLGIRTEIVGHSDQTGTDAVNVDLSRQRADNVLAALVLRGLKPINIGTVGASSRDPLKEEVSVEESEINRSVTFRVVLYNAF